MTTQQIQIILDIYRTGSISKAAKNLFLAQPNISSSLRLLEEELGFPIFVRSNKGVQPTAKGMVILEQAGLMWESYQKMQKVATSQSEATRVHIGGASYTPICEAYIKLCEEYQHSETLNMPFIQAGGSIRDILDPLYMSTLDLEVLVFSRELDELKHEAERKGIDFQEFAQVPLCLRIGPHHPLYNKPDLTLEDLRDYPFVDYPSNPFFSKIRRADFSLPSQQRVMLVDDKRSKLELVSRTCAYSVGCKVPTSLTQQLGLRNVPLGDLMLHIVTLSRKDQKRSKPILRYLELLRKEINAL